MDLTSAKPSMLSWGKLQQHLGAGVGRREQAEDIPFFCLGVDKMFPWKSFYRTNKH